MSNKVDADFYIMIMYGWMGKADGSVCWSNAVGGQDEGIFIKLNRSQGGEVDAIQWPEGGIGNGIGYQGN